MAENHTDVTSFLTPLPEKCKETNDEVFSTIVIALIVVSGVLFLVSLVAIVCACSLWRLHNGLHPFVRFHGSVENTLTEDVVDNTSRQDTSTAWNSVDDAMLDAGEINIERSILRKTTGSQLKFDEQEQIYSFDVETSTLGFNTVAKREHKLDQQTQKMQLLFQSFSREFEDHELDPTLPKKEIAIESQPAASSFKKHSNSTAPNSVSSKHDETDVKMPQNSNPKVLKYQDNENLTVTLPNIHLPSDDLQIIDEKNSPSSTDIDTHF